MPSPAAPPVASPAPMAAPRALMAPMAQPSTAGPRPPWMQAPPGQPLPPGSLAASAAPPPYQPAAAGAGLPGALGAATVGTPVATAVPQEHAAPVIRPSAPLNPLAAAAPPLMHGAAPQASASARMANGFHPPHPAPVSTTWLMDALLRIPVNDCCTQSLACSDRAYHTHPMCFCFLMRILLLM